MSALFEIGAQLAIVVDLAVENDGDAVVFVEGRLFAGDEIDDREPTHAERDAARDKQALLNPAHDEPCARTSSAAVLARLQEAACVDRDWPNR